MISNHDPVSNDINLETESWLNFTVKEVIDTREDVPFEPFLVSNSSEGYFYDTEGNEGYIF